MKKIIPFILLISILISCSDNESSTEPSVSEKTSREKVKLVMVIKNYYSKATDVYGDTLKRQYYAWTKKGLIPVDEFFPTPRFGIKSIAEYLDAKKAMGNLKSDTMIHFPVNPNVDGGRYADLILYDITGLSVKASLQ